MEEISLYEYWQLIRGRYKTVFFFIGLSFLSMLVYVVTTPRVYRSVSLILPSGPGPGGSGAGALMAAQLAGLPLNLGGGASDKLKVFIQSRSLAERVAKAMNLDEALAIKLPSKEESIRAAAATLMGMVSVVPDDSQGTIELFVESTDPRLATQINHRVLKELQGYIENDALSESKRHRIFVGEQLLNSEKELLEIGKLLAEYYQANQITSGGATLDIDLTLPEIPTPPNLDPQTLEKQGVDLTQDKEALDKKLSEKVVGVPQQIYLEYLNQKRFILNQLNGVLTNQYQMAKMEEEKENLAFQIIDEAREPKSPFKPNVRLLLLMSLVGGCLLGILYVFIVEYLQQMKEPA